VNRIGRSQVLSVPAGYEEPIAKERLERILQCNVVPKEQGIRGLAGKNDWPRFLEEESEVYEREELDSLFAVCDEQERLWYEFFLMTGMREQEVMRCSWGRWKPVTKHDHRALQATVRLQRGSGCRESKKKSVFNPSTNQAHPTNFSHYGNAAPTVRQLLLDSKTSDTDPQLCQELQILLVSTSGCELPSSPQAEHILARGR
jgi:hypothetical protein